MDIDTAIQDIKLRQAARRQQASTPKLQQKSIVRGPAHITQTDAWMSRGDTLGLFKRGDWVSSSWCRESVRAVTDDDEIYPGPLDRPTEIRGELV